MSMDNVDNYYPRTSHQSPDTTHNRKLSTFSCRYDLPLNLAPDLVLRLTEVVTAPLVAGVATVVVSVTDESPESAPTVGAAKLPQSAVTVLWRRARGGGRGGVVIRTSGLGQGLD